MRGATHNPALPHAQVVNMQGVMRRGLMKRAEVRVGKRPAPPQGCVILSAELTIAFNSQITIVVFLAWMVERRFVNKTFHC
jgi:hypothetical protein